MKEPTSLMIDSQLYSTIKLLAVLKTMNISEVIEEALKLYLHSQKHILETIPKIPEIEELLVEKDNPTTGRRPSTQEGGENNENQINRMVG